MYPIVVTALLINGAVVIVAGGADMIAATLSWTRRATNKGPNILRAMVANSDKQSVKERGNSLAKCRFVQALYHNVGL